MLVSADFRERARNALSGNWGVAVGTGFVASLLGAYTAFSNSGGGSSSSSDVSEEDMEVIAQQLPAEVWMTIAAVLGIIAIVAVVYAIVTLIIGGPVTLGYVKFNLDMVNGYRPSFSDLFSQFGRFKEAFVMRWLLIYCMRIRVCLPAMRLQLLSR